MCWFRISLWPKSPLAGIPFAFFSCHRHRPLRETRVRRKRVSELQGASCVCLPVDFEPFCGASSGALSHCCCLPSFCRPLEARQLPIQMPPSSSGASLQQVPIKAAPTTTVRPVLGKPLIKQTPSSVPAKPEHCGYVSVRSVLRVLSQPCER